MESVLVLVESCTNLKVFGLQEIGKLLDEFTYGVCQAARRSTDLSLLNLGNGEVVSEKALVEVLEAVGASLEHLDLSDYLNITDASLFRGIKPHVQSLSSLVLYEHPRPDRRRCG